MKIFALLPLATLLFAAAVSGEEEESIKPPGPNGIEISVPSGKNLSSNGYSVSAKGGESENGTSISYDGFGSPHDNEPNEQSGNKLSVQYGGKNQTSSGRGKRRYLHGQRRHNRVHRSYGVLGSRHESHGASKNGSHSHGGHIIRHESHRNGSHSIRHESHRNSSHESHHGSRQAGHQGSLFARLSGGLENIAKNVPGGPSGSLDLGNITKNIPSGPSGSLDLGNIAKNIPSGPSGLLDLGNLQGQAKNAAPAVI